MNLFGFFGNYSGNILLSVQDLNKQLKYDNFDLSSHTISFGVALLCLFIGILFAILINLFRNETSGRAVRLLLKADAIGEDNAKTPKELGFDNSFFLRFILKDKAYLRKIIKCAGQEPALNRLKMIPSQAFSEMKLYIPEEQKFRAEEQFKRKGNDLPAAIFAIIIAIIMFFLILYQLPNLLDLLDSVLG